MKLITVVSFVAAILAIIGVLYSLLVGQRTLLELWKNLKQKRRKQIIFISIILFALFISMFFLKLFKEQNYKDINFEPIEKYGYNTQNGYPNRIRSKVDPTIVFILVPESETSFGAKADTKHAEDDEKPYLEKIYLDAYYITEYEITNAQYKKFLGSCKWKGAPFRVEHWAKPYCWNRKTCSFEKGKENYPVVLVSWQDAFEYSQWLGVRLPTEMEWEKAAKGTDDRIYPWGNLWEPSKSRNLESFKNVKFNSKKEWMEWIKNVWALYDPIDRNSNTLSPVGSHSRDISPYGCYDMAGNVKEWCMDWYTPMRYSQILKRNDFVNPTLPKENEALLFKVWDMKRVVRGGSWMDPFFNCRNTDRKQMSPLDSDGPLGFRCAFSASLIKSYFTLKEKAN